MPNDFQKAQPTKNEKMFYELVMRQEAMGRDLWTVSANVLALGILLDVDPKKVAELLVDDTKIKEYADKINVALRELEDARKAKLAAEGKTDEHAGHDHAGHDHSMHDHSHHDHDHSDPNHKHE